MAKKNIWIIVAASVVVAAVVGVVIFLIATRDVETNSNTDLLTGTWQVIYQNPDMASEYTKEKCIDKNQYLVFKDGKVTIYSDGKTVHTGDYTIDGNAIGLKDLDPKLGFPEDLTIDKSGSKNYLKLTNAARGWEIIRRDVDIDNPAPFDRASLQGKWDVTLKGRQDTTPENATLEFDTEELTVAHANITSSIPNPLTYEWKDGDTMEIQVLGKVVMFKVADNCVILVELNNGTVWEITRAQ